MPCPCNMTDTLCSVRKAAPFGNGNSRVTMDTARLLCSLEASLIDAINTYVD